MKKQNRQESDTCNPNLHQATLESLLEMPIMQKNSGFQFFFYTKINLPLNPIFFP